LKKPSRTPASPRPAANPPGRVRIIGGRFRRTPIAVVAGPGLRPTPDRVRETLFNWLEHLLGDLSAARVLDLFAGSGALGFEMASRGARRVVLVEHHPRAAAALRALQARLSADAVTVVPCDWRAAVAQLAPESFDVIFLDPPFDSGILPHAVEAAGVLLAPGGLLYAESDRPLEPATLAGGPFETVRAGRAGAVHFHLLRKRPC
jgi:16S rRNA (guanine966-N2)-methyltransferase